MMVPDWDGLLSASRAVHADVIVSGGHLTQPADVMPPVSAAGNPRAAVRAPRSLFISFALPAWESLQRRSVASGDVRAARALYRDRDARADTLSDSSDSTGSGFGPV